MVTDNNYLILNSGRDYSITIESDTMVESFCIFFSEEQVNEIYTSLILTEESLLNEGNSRKQLTGSCVEFFEKTYPEDKVLSPTLNGIRHQTMTRAVNSLWLDIQINNLLYNMITLHIQEMSKVNSINNVRLSTRKELYKRVSIGHDYMNAFYNRNLRLEEIARAAMLSPNHFLRTYKQIFGITPNQFLVEKRLHVAKQMLLKTTKSITQICLDVGFQSVSNFSWIFSLRFKDTPSKFRKKNNIQEVLL